MIDFILIRKREPQINLDQFNSFELSEDYVLFYKDSFYIVENEFKRLIIIGDCITIPTVSDLASLDIDSVIDKLKGNFYIFLSYKDELSISSSALGLLPIYYQSDFSVISSSIKLIHKESEIDFTENKKWILNQLLFNYQFGNDTFYKEIQLFPPLSYLRIKEKNFAFKKYYCVADSFTTKPKSWKNSLEELSKLFIKNTEQYIPDNNAVISFTGGFDGRTIVSVASHFQKKFETFSYGKIENDDVFIPKQNSEDLNISYNWLDLDTNYADKEYLGCSREFIKNTDGANGFLYAHVDYSARKVSEENSFLLSGVCGSELFRAAHSSGAVTSKALLDLFKSGSLSDYRNSILKSDVFKYIKFEEYQVELEELILETWKYRQDLPNKLTENQKLYVFVYEEIFRKFFGAWVKAQMNYINIRTPFIDFDFFKAIIKTELSGAYSDFLTENPLKRFKGQVLYADIIKKTNCKLYNLKTGKGYAPKIIREPLLRPLLLLPFIMKRLKRNIKPTNLDNLAIISGIKGNSKQIIREYDLFGFNKEELLSDIKSLSPYTKESERDTLLTVLSVLIYKDTINE